MGVLSCQGRPRSSVQRKLAGEAGFTSSRNTHQLPALPS